MNKEVKILKPFTRFLMTIGEIPSSYLVSMTYEEQLIWFCNYLEKTIIPTINNNSEVVQELVDYVTNYFNNLDVQEEINNKLDEMAESGELQEIIVAYLQVKGVLGFDTLADLKEATNLQEGSFTRTMGNITYLDGKGAYYRVRELLNTDVIDDINIVALTNYPTLIAELIPESNPLSFNTLSDMKLSQNLLEGDIISTLGYHSINDGGKATYKVRLKEESETTNDMDVIALYNEDLVADFIHDDTLNLKQFGAYGDDNNDDTNALTYAVEYSTTNDIELYIPKGIYLINGDIAINNKIKGNEAQIHFNDGNNSFYVNANSSFKLKDLELNCHGHAIQINNENNVNSTIDNCKINATGYGVLVNSNSDGGKDLKITNNNIYAGSDAIEINTIHSASNKYNNILIENNILETDTDRTGTTSGFTIGIARGKKILINNNVVNMSRNEAIHIEDGTEDLIITNNIINDCVNDGIRILMTNSLSTQTPIISNNIINSSNTQGTGIRGIYDTNGLLSYTDLTNNRIKGFHNGITIGGAYGQSFNLNGSIIENCDNGLVLPASTNVTGNVTFRNCTTGLYVSGDRSNINIDSLTFDTPVDPTTFIVSTKNNSVINIRRLTLRFRYEASATGDYHKVVLCSLPKYISGTISGKLTGAGGELSRNNNLSYDGTTLTSTSINSYSYGGISGTFIEDNGNLIWRVYAPTLAVGSSLAGQVTIDGLFSIGGTYNN